MDYELTSQEFEQLSRLVHQQSGINLHEGKRDLLRARLSKRLRELEMKSFRAYYDYVLRDTTGREMVTLLDSVSTNLTAFFREPAHLDYLSRVVVPRLAARRGAGGGRRLWVWSAGCSTGEEPYSIGLCLLSAISNRAIWDLKVMATDISTRALETARHGIYSAKRVSSMPPGMLPRFFQRGVGEWTGHYRVKNDVRRLVRFMRANLLEQPPFGGQL
ncbi:MAG: protein-glutamate O-methyltransferase CheR, partial [Pseudomonadota bacterium]